MDPTTDIYKTPDIISTVGRDKSIRNHSLMTYYGVFLSMAAAINNYVMILLYNQLYFSQICGGYMWLYESNHDYLRLITTDVIGRGCILSGGFIDVASDHIVTLANVEHLYLRLGFPLGLRLCFGLSGRALLLRAWVTGGVVEKKRQPSTVDRDSDF